MAVRYWVPGGDTGWTSTNNWSTASGGASGASAPVSTDSVVFDANSGTGLIIIGAATTVAAVTITNCSSLSVLGNYNFSVTSSLTYNGGTFNFTNTGTVTIGGTLIVNSSATTGTLAFNNTGSVTVSGTTTFTSGGAYLNFTNTTSVSLAALTVNGAGGYLQFQNSTTVALSGAMSVTSTGSKVNFFNSTTVTLTSLQINASSSDGFVRFNNSSTVALTSLTYSSTASPGTTVLFDTNVTTVTVSGVGGLNIGGTYSNVTFSCATLSLTGASSNIKAGPCTMYCNVNISGGSTLTSDLTTSGAFTLTGALSLAGYILTANSANVNAAITWNTSTRSCIVLNYDLTHTTILVTGASFTKTLLAGNSGYFQLNLGSSGYADNAYITTNSSGDPPNISVYQNSYAIFSTQLTNTGTSTLYLGTVFFDTSFTSTFLTNTLNVAGSLTFNSVMTINCTSITLNGTGSYTSAGQVLACDLGISATGTITLQDNCVTTGRFKIWSGTLNLNDKIVTCGKLSIYNGNAASVVTIAINGGTGQTGTIIIRDLGVHAGSPNWTSFPTMQSAYTGGGSTYTITNNPTFIIEPTYGSGNGELFIYNDNIIGNLIIKNALDNVSWNFLVNFYSATTAMLNDMSIADSFAGTVDTGPYEIHGNLFIGNNVTLSSSTSGFTFIPPTTTTKTITVGATASFLRPITIAGPTATAITQLLSNVIINKTLTLTTGKLDLNNYAFTASAFDSSVAGTRVIGFGTSGKIVTTGSGTAFNYAATVTYTGTSRVEISNSGSTATTVATGTNTEANSLNFYINSGTYALTLTGTTNTLDFTGFSGSVAVATAPTVYGNLILSSGMTVTSGGTGTFTLGTSTITNITTNNKTIDHPITINGIGSYTLVDSLTMGSTATSILSHTKGNIDLNGNTLTTLNVSSTGAIARSITFNSGKIYITGSSTSAWTASGSNFTTSAGNGNGLIYMTNNSSLKYFAGGGYTYAATLVQAGYGNLTIQQNNTFVNLKNSVVPANISITSNTTQTFTQGFGLKGSAGALVSLNAVSIGTAGNVSLASGTVNCDYLILKDSRATGGASWSAGNHSVNVSNNTGWYFTAAPTANPQMMMLFPL